MAVRTSQESFHYVSPFFILHFIFSKEKEIKLRIKERPLTTSQIKRFGSRSCQRSRESRIICPSATNDREKDIVGLMDRKIILEKRTTNSKTFTDNQR